MWTKTEIDFAAAAERLEELLKKPGGEGEALAIIATTMPFVPDLIEDDSDETEFLLYTAAWAIVLDLDALEAQCFALLEGVVVSVESDTAHEEAQLIISKFYWDPRRRR